MPAKRETLRSGAVLAGSFPEPQGRFRQVPKTSRPWEEHFGVCRKPCKTGLYRKSVGFVAEKVIFVKREINAIFGVYSVVGNKLKNQDI